MRILHKLNRNQSVDLETRIGSMCRHRQPDFISLFCENQAYTGKKFEIALTFGKFCLPDQRCHGMRRRAEDAPPLEVAWLDVKRANYLGNAHLDVAAADHGSQEFAGEESFLGRRETAEGVGELS